MTKIWQKRIIFKTWSRRYKAVCFYLPIAFRISNHKKWLSGILGRLFLQEIVLSFLDSYLDEQLSNSFQNSSTKNSSGFSSAISVFPVTVIGTTDTFVQYPDENTLEFIWQIKQQWLPAFLMVGSECLFDWKILASNNAGLKKERWTVQVKIW